MYLSGLIRKEFSRIKADKRTLILIFAIPIILIVIFGLTSGGGPTEYYNAAIISRDNIPYETPEFPLESNSSLNYDEIFIDVVEDDCSAWGLIESYECDSEEEYDDAFEECYELLRS